MDYCVFTMLGLTARSIKKLLFTYDIACQWSVHLLERLEDTYTNIYQLPDDATITFAIPKFHLEAHGEDCKCAFNLNHLAGVGRTYGEGIESGWADMNLVSIFTREMGSAHRHEVIEDFMQAINFRKVKMMGK
jgi:hypothetical protein